MVVKWKLTTAWTAVVSSSKRSANTGWGGEISLWLISSIDATSMYVHCCCGVYVYFDKQMLHGWSCIILGSKIQLYLCSYEILISICSYEILISISTQCKKALASVFQSLSREANRRMSRLACLFLLLAAATTIAEKCLHPPPAENYSNQLYAGQWFEVIIKLILAEWKLFLQVGKYQTIGGAIFQIGTVCTEANFSPYGIVGDGDIG